MQAFVSVVTSSVKRRVIDGVQQCSAKIVVGWQSRF
jgi:hypothetical protein